MSDGRFPCGHGDEPTRVAFLMTWDYTIVTLTSAIAVLRMANRLSERQLYRWTCLTLDGKPVPSSDGLRLVPDGEAGSLDRPDMLFVCGGYHCERHCSGVLLDALRRFAKRGVPLGALCTGSHFLAAAGLLDGYRCAIHWENLSSLREQFPRVHVSSRLFEIDRDRFTCSGGISSIDMMLNLVQAAHGQELARDITEQIILERVRTENDMQRTPLHHQLGAVNQQSLVDAVALMEGNIEEPLALGEVAKYTDISPRQLERLFHEYLECTPSRYYLDLRLNQGRLLLLQTSMSVTEIASRCGFSTAARFGKSYVAKYGKRPTDERRPAP
ncbi:MAG: GlxA family transcriptional regulator [Gammaproteobacteria bacterium]|nr:GlxA family transcriptional regulator [Gammaproteobacteria bacterium]